MTFASKKEADAHDKLLDMAEAFTDWLLQSGMQMDETQAENLGLYLAEQKESVQHILRTSKLPELNAATDKTASDADSSKNPGRQSRLIVRTTHHLSCRRGKRLAASSCIISIFSKTMRLNILICSGVKFGYSISSRQTYVKTRESHVRRL